MKELFPSIYEWSFFSQEKQYDFNGHLVVKGKERVLIDPPPMTPEEESYVQRMGPIAAIIITNVHHVREAERYRCLFSTKVYAPELDLKNLDITPDGTFHDGDQLPAGLEAVVVPDNKSSGETALYARHREGGIWILGDALIGKPLGKLNLMPPDKYKDVKKAKEGIRVLLQNPFDVVLVGDGSSILKEGKKALEHFFAEKKA